MYVCRHLFESVFYKFENVNSLHFCIFEVSFFGVKYAEELKSTPKESLAFTYFKELRKNYELIFSGMCCSVIMLRRQSIRDFLERVTWLN